MALTQSHFRFGINELAESTHGWHAAEDANPLPNAIPVDTTFLLRFTLQDSGTAQANVDPEFWFRRNGGAWTQITTSSAYVKAVLPVCWANTNACTKRLSGTGTFIGAAGCTSDGQSGGTSMDIAASGNAETECGLQLVGTDIKNGDRIEFRLTRDSGVLIDTYAVTPIIDVPLAVSVSNGGESVRSFDRLLGAAAGVALIAAGLLETPVLRIADAVQAELVPPSNLSVQVKVECIESQDWVYGAARNTQVDRATGLLELPPIKLRDTLTVVMTAETPVSVSEGIKADDGGRVDLYGLGNPIKITDGPPVAVIVEDNSLATVISNESLKVVDSTPVGFLFDPNLITTQVGAEAVKADDGGRVDLIGLGNPIKISDGPVVAQLVGDVGDPSTNVSESLKVADSLAVSITPVFALLSETFKVVDSGEVEIVKDETVRVLDSLAVVINPEQTTLEETFKVADQLTVTREGEGEIATSLSESLEVADAVVISLNPEQATPAESLKVADALTAQLGDIFLPLGESLKVADAPTPTLTPELASVAEGLSVVDTLTVTLGGDLATNVGEALRIIDVTSLTLDPEQATPVESLKVVDTVTVALQLATVVEEALKVVDTLAVSRGLDAQVSEGLSVVDSLSIQRTVLEANLSESLKVTDTLSVTTGSTIAAPPAEAVKVVESLTVALNPEEIARTEDVKIGDTLAVALTPVLAEIAEGVTVVDSPSVSLSHLDASVSEGLRVADLTPRFSGPSIIEVVGSYVTSIEVIGSYITSIEVIGSMGETE